MTVALERQWLRRKKMMLRSMLILLLLFSNLLLANTSMTFSAEENYMTRKTEIYASLSKKPDFVFYDGVRIYNGSAGNGSYEYRVTQTFLYGEKYEPDHIEVYKDNQLITSDEILNFSPQ